MSNERFNTNKKVNSMKTRVEERRWRESRAVSQLPYDVISNRRALTKEETGGGARERPS